jgi:hypothetical protein
MPGVAQQQDAIYRVHIIIHNCPVPYFLLGVCWEQFLAHCYFYYTQWLASKHYRLKNIIVCGWHILISGDNVTYLQYKISNVLNRLQTWFELNNFVVNAEEAMAMPFYTLQSKRPMSTYIFEGRDIQYKM